MFKTDTFMTICIDRRIRNQVTMQLFALCDVQFYYNISNELTICTLLILGQI